MVLSAPHPHLGTEGLSVTQPAAGPRLGTVWPLSLGQGAIWGCLRATGARGGGGWAWGMLAWLGCLGGGMSKQKGPPQELWGRPSTSRCPTRPSFLHPLPGKPKALSLPAVTSSRAYTGQPGASCWGQRSGQHRRNRPGGNRHLPRGHHAPSDEGLNFWNVSRGTYRSTTAPPCWPRQGGH